MDPKDVLRRFFATLSTGDFDATGEFFDDDSVWQVNNVAQGHPGERGRRAIIEDFLRPVREGLFEPDTAHAFDVSRGASADPDQLPDATRGAP